MTDTPTSNNRLRKQSLGSNTNTWGDTKLNEVLDAIDQAMDGTQSFVLTGDYTLSTVNYTTADEAKNRVLKFTGTLSSPANVTIPSVDHEYAIVNTAGATITVKTFAGTGVDVPNGYQARVYCDGANVYNGSPTVLPGSVRVSGQIKNLTAGTDSTDAVSKTQMETAIANASIPASAGTVLNSSNDTTAGYLGQKIIQSTTLSTTQINGLVSVQTLSPGGNEKLGLSGFVGGYLDGGTKSTQFTPSIGSSYDVDCTSASVTINLSGMATPQIGQQFNINKFGANNAFLLGTVNGATDFSYGAPFNTVLRYCGPTWGWNFTVAGIKSVQYGTITFDQGAGAVSGTATITSVNINKAVLINLGTTFDTNATTATNFRSLATSKVKLVLTNATTVTSNIGVTGGLGNTVTSFVVQEYY